MMSVWTCSARWNRVAIPCGLDPSGALSAAAGMPDEAENPTVTGVEGREACGALVNSAASGEETNVPGNTTAARGPDMEKLAALNGEVVTIAVDPGRARVVACTSDCDAAVLEAGGPSEASTSLVRSALESVKANWSPDLDAAFIAGRLYLTFGSFELKGGGHSALLAVDLDAGTTAEIYRDTDGFFTGRVSPPVGVDD